MSSRNHAEDNESRYLWDWAQLNPVLREHLYHIPNGGKRNAREAARMKRMGVRAGVHDYHLPVPRGAFHGLWIELKAKGGRPTASQLEWRDKMQAQGYAAYIAVGWMQAASVFRWYLALPVPDLDFEHPSLEVVLADDAMSGGH